MTDGGQVPWQRRTQQVVAVAALAVAPGLLTGNALSGLVPLLLITFVYCLWRAPLRWAMLGLFFVALSVESPQERPAFGLWKTPLSEPGTLLYENLNNLTGIKPLRFSALDIVLVMLVGAALVRGRSARRSRNSSRGTPSERPFPRASGLNAILGVVFLTLVGLEVFGVATGGDFKASLWQLRELLWLPVLVWLFQETLRGPRDLVTIGVIVIAACTLKALEGLYFYEVICRPLNMQPLRHHPF